MQRIDFITAAYIAGATGDSVADAIDTRSTQSKEKRRETGRRPRQYIQEQHTWSAFADRILADAMEISEEGNHS